MLLHPCVHTLAYIRLHTVAVLMCDPEQCPHDGACPLYNPGESKRVCGFSQRIQRPAFVRKTKHSGVGHEDVGYSYVVVRRGERPAQPEGAKPIGRLGQVGKRELAKQIAAQVKANPPVLREESLSEVPRQDTRVDATQVNEDSSETLSAAVRADNAPDDLHAVLRQEAYTWPRLVFPPLKRSGHVILDVCTPQGALFLSSHFRISDRPLLKGRSFVRQDHASDDSKVAGETAILRRAQVGVG
jgi:ribosomal protein RSM22 (predicted rRNA methylase)